MFPTPNHREVCYRRGEAEWLYINLCGLYETANEAIKRQQESGALGSEWFMYLVGTAGCFIVTHAESVCRRG